MQGLRAALHEPAILPVLLVKGLLGLSGGIALVLAVFGDRVFRLGSTAAGGIGLLYGARGVGTAIGPILGRRFGSATGSRAREAIALGFLVASIAFLTGVLVRSLPAAVFAFTVSGIGSALAWVFSTVVLQAETHDALRGRVFAAEQALLTLAVAVSMVATGHALDHPGWTARGVGVGLSLLYLVSGGAFVGLVRRARRAAAAGA